MDVLTSETCWALNNVIIKQVTSSWSLFIHRKCCCVVKCCQAAVVAGDISTSHTCVKMLPYAYITAFVYSSRCNLKPYLNCFNFALFRSLYMHSENMRLWNLQQILWRILCVSSHFLRAICLWKYLNNTCSGTLFRKLLFNVFHPEVFNTHINKQWCISQTQQNFIMFINVLGQHVSILIESSSGPSKIQIIT